MPGPAWPFPRVGWGFRPPLGRGFRPLVLIGPSDLFDAMLQHGFIPAYFCDDLAPLVHMGVVLRVYFIIVALR